MALEETLTQQALRRFKFKMEPLGFINCQREKKFFCCWVFI